LNENVISSAHHARVTVRSVINAVADDVAENGPVVAPGRQGPAVGVVVVAKEDGGDALDDDDGPAVVEELFFSEPPPHAVSIINSATMMENARTRSNQTPFPLTGSMRPPAATRTGRSTIARPAHTGRYAVTDLHDRDGVIVEAVRSPLERRNGEL
jgi:hypothetical protein